MAFDPASSQAPEWIHLIPTTKGAIQTDDNRGPYFIEDADAVIAASFATEDRLILDQDHATDKGMPAPARGWIVEMQARADGIWGRVEWTREGAAMVVDRAYRAISPVIFHDKAKRIFAVPRASLVNRPNFKGLTALNHTQEEETQVNQLEQIALALGLQASASGEDILAAIRATKPADPALQSSLQAAQEAMTALQATVSEQATQITALTEGAARREAEAFVDQAIADKRAGLSANTRAHYVSMHMADPAMAKTTIESLPKLGPTGMTATPPVALKEGEISLNASQVEAAKLLGISTKDYAATLKADAEKEAR